MYVCMYVCMNVCVCRQDIYPFQKHEKTKIHQKKQRHIKEINFFDMSLCFLVGFFLFICFLKKCTLNPKRNSQIDKIAIHIRNLN